MRDTQLAKPNPLRKKIAATAARALDLEMGLGGWEADIFEIERVGVMAYSSVFE